MKEMVIGSDNFDGVCYQKTFLDRVIFRFDFLKPVSSDKIFSEQIIDAILKEYPSKGKQERFFVGQVEVNFNNRTGDSKCAAEMTSKGSFFKQSFEDRSGNKIFLANTYVVLETVKYDNYDKVRNTISGIFDKLLVEGNDCSIGRVGARYINIFPSSKVVFKKKYFSKDVASVYQTKSSLGNNQFILVRSLRREEYKYKSMSLNFVYGMYNPDYPKKMEKMDFVMDLDCFLQDYIVEKSKVMNVVDDAHYAVQCLFEQSITDALRGEMNNG